MSLHHWLTSSVVLLLFGFVTERYALTQAAKMNSVKIGDSLENFASISTSANISRPDYQVIQKDEWRDGGILITDSTAIYSIDKIGDITVLAGNPFTAGFRNGDAITQALFDQISGITQLPDGILLISDLSNRCIRQLQRKTQLVSTYAGDCTADQETNYTMIWKRFNQPRTLHYDSKRNTIYLLDNVSTDINIIEKRLQPVDPIHVVHTFNGIQEVNNFVYDPISNSFAISAIPDGILNISYTGNRQPIFQPPDNSTITGLAINNGLLIVSLKGVNESIKLIDITQGSGNEMNLCSEMNSESVCSLERFTAVAVIDNYLYISSLSPGEMVTKIRRVSFGGDETVTIKRDHSVTIKRDHSGAPRSWTSGTLAASIAAIHGLTLLT